MFRDPVAAAYFEYFQARYHFQTIIETGTHLGGGIANWSLYRKLVCSIELQQEFRDQALVNLQQQGYKLDTIEMVGKFGALQLRKTDSSGDRLIHSFQGTSPAVLDAIVSSKKYPGPYLFFLDAHWYEDWPLLAELEVIEKHKLADSCIIIHDFKVPGKPFGFDTCRQKTATGQIYMQPLDFDYVKAHLSRINPQYACFANERACTGAQGVLYAVPPDGDPDPRWRLPFAAGAVLAAEPDALYDDGYHRLAARKIAS